MKKIWNCQKRFVYLQQNELHNKKISYFKIFFDIFSTFLDFFQTTDYLYIETNIKVKCTRFSRQ